jgi:CHAT domain-containing protein/tetratricopeptide (TPR) repeat protein
MKPLGVACAIAMTLLSGQTQAFQRGAVQGQPAAITEAAARSALTAAEQRDGGDSAATAAALDVLVETLWRGNPRAADAKALAERAVAIKERLHGGEHAEVARSLHNAGNLLAERGEHAAAEQMLERALRIRERVLGPDDLAVAAVLADLALEVSANGNYERAKSLHERALAIRETRLGGADLAVAVTLNNLGALLKDMGRYSEAEPVLRRSLTIREQHLGGDHLLVASTLNNIGFLEIERGRYDAARRIYDRVIAINERVYGPGHQVVARTITNVAIATAQSGDYSESRRLFGRALETMERALGPTHPDVASALNNLATIDQRIGDLSSARALHERALRLREAVLPVAHPDIAESLHNLGAVLRSIGDYAGARTLYDRALVIREKAYGPEHRAVASTLNNLGAALRDLGQAAAAERSYARALAILEKAVGPSHLLVAQVLTNLGPVLHDLGRNAAAEGVLRRSLAIYETSYGAEHPMAAAAHENLAFHFHQRGDHARAKAEYQRAFDIRTTALGPGHPDNAGGLAGLATELVEQGEIEEAFRIAALAESTSVGHVRATASTLPERQALLLAATRASGLDVAISIALERPGVVRDADARAMDLVVRSRALVLDEMAARQRDQIASLDPDVRQARLQLASTRRRLANLVVRSASTNAATVRRDLEQARAENEAAERGLAERHASFKRERAGTRATLTDVVAALPAEVTLIAYATYRPQPAAGGKGDGDASRYAAFVVRPDGSTRAIRLDRSSRIDAMIEKWRNAVTGGMPTRASERAARAAGLLLRRAIWDPLADALPDDGVILVVPDGAINLVNIAALPDDHSGYLVEAKARLHYLSAERDLVTMTAAADGASGLLALGGAAFGPIPTAASTAAMRGGECSPLDSVRFEPLPGTSREAATIVDLWKQSSGSNVQHLSGRGATEAAFKEQAPGRRLLHLATHGFVIGERCGSAAASTRGVGGLAGPTGRTATTNPLRLAGLAMAGANRRAAARAGDEDGIVTAEEIAALDLSAAEWTVLSACDTGLGEIRAGEGVFGLRRAFAVAGARTTIMSLWSVEDRATLDWMAALYRARLLDRRSTAESVKHASLTTLRSRRARGLNTHPFYWAGFVAAGDWR